MSQVRTRKRGKTFSYIFEAGKINGKRKVVEKGGYPTKSAAIKAGTLAYADWLHGNIGITSESITLKDFITKWLAEVVSVNVKATTMQTYRTIFDRQIAPYLGEVKVQDLTPAMLDKWIRNLQKAGLSYNTISAILAFIHNALKYAVYPAQLISTNPAAYIKVPKNAPRNVVKRHIISPEQFKALVGKYPFGTPPYIPLLLLYHTGMRISEVLGLLTKMLLGEGLNAHSFRHTHTTQLAEIGVSAKAIAGRLGHADATITQNLYTHNTEKLQEETAAIFGKTLQTNQ